MTARYQADTGVPARPDMNTSGDSRDPLIGTCLDGRYVITGVLGRGGMGIVYEGVHEQLERAVAIKVLGPDTATDPVVVERFLREARFASSLGHGNIVDVSDLGRLADGRPYLVMPRVPGVDLAMLLVDEGPMPPARVAELLRGVAAALDLVHAKGLAHRDVKPENLLHVVREDGSEAVMLTDFGIASLVALKAARLTAEGMVCGTPAYVAPELIETGEFDRRADVYALATVAFELLTGRLPFREIRPTRMLSAKVERDAPSLSAAARRRFAQDLEEVIARGLARDPERRFQSAGGFVAALEEAAHQAPSDEDPAYTPTLRGQVVRERSVSAVHAREPALAREPVARRRRRARMLAAGAFGAGLAAWVSIGGWLHASKNAPRTPPRPSPRPAPSVAAPAAPDLAELSSLPQPEARQSAPDENPLPTPEARRIPERVPRVSRARSRRTAYEQRNAPPPQPPPPPTRTGPTGPSTDELDRAANQQLLQGRLARALELFERASEQDPRDAAAYRGLAVAYERSGRSADAVQAYRRALELQPHGPQAAALRERLQKLEAAH